MLSRLSSPVGFSAIPALPARTKLTFSYFCDDAIPKIVDEIPFDLATSL
jgi:hypothetical protein